MILFLLTYHVMIDPDKTPILNTLAACNRELQDDKFSKGAMLTREIELGTVHCLPMVMRPSRVKRRRSLYWFRPL